MPILEVEIVVPPAEALRGGMAAEIADRAGEVFGASPGTTWVKMRLLPWEAYAENGGGPPAGVYPVFVSVLKRKNPAPEQMQREVTLLTKAIAQICTCSEANVHILYLPEGAGRVAFGGQVVSA